MIDTELYWIFARYVVISHLENPFCQKHIPIKE